MADENQEFLRTQSHTTVRPEQMAHSKYTLWLSKDIFDAPLPKLRVVLHYCVASTETLTTLLLQSERGTTPDTKTLSILYYYFYLSILSRAQSNYEPKPVALLFSIKVLIDFPARATRRGRVRHFTTMHHSLSHMLSLFPSPRSTHPCLLVVMGSLILCNSIM